MDVLDSCEGIGSRGLNIEQDDVGLQLGRHLLGD
jgi:hypothetical protein